MERVDLTRLLKLRLVVGRVGEMDLARWWNTNGMLGPRGATVLRRGFPRTHFFAQASVVFAVARTRCEEVFNPPGCMTLWSLPAQLEDDFQEHWQLWLDEGDQWSPFFESLAAIQDADLVELLTKLELLSPTQAEEVRALRRSAEGRAVMISGTHQPNDEIVGLLAASFSRGEPGKPAIPYARLEG